MNNNSNSLVEKMVSYSVVVNDENQALRELSNGDYMLIIRKSIEEESEFVSNNTVNLYYKTFGPEAILRKKADMVKSGDCNIQFVQRKESDKKLIKIFRSQFGDDYEEKFDDYAKELYGCNCTIKGERIIETSVMRSQQFIDKKIEEGANPINFEDVLLRYDNISELKEAREAHKS